MPGLPKGEGAGAAGAVAVGELPPVPVPPVGPELELDLLDSCCAIAAAAGHHAATASQGSQSREEVIEECAIASGAEMCHPVSESPAPAQLLRTRRRPNVGAPCRELARKCGVAAAPGSGFPRGMLRFIPLAVILLASAHAEDFALRGGDTLAFLGDSITAARGYTKIVELYTILRFPGRDVHFVNAGKGGDTASGALARLDHDVFAAGATVVTVVFGVNDIGWGMKADAGHRQRYLDGVRGIVEACQQRGVRAIVCSPAITNEAPDTAENGFLQQMTDEGLALASSLGAGTIDLQRGMRDIQRRVLAASKNVSDPGKQVKLHVADGVHLNDLGHLALAYAMLKGLGAPADVSSLVLDAKTGAVIEATGCRAADVQAEPQELRFTRHDEGLPLNLGAFSVFNYRFVPVPDGLNRYRLAVKNLPAGKYEIRADDRPLGTVTARQLEAGLNISSMTASGWEPGGPWDAQAVAVKALTDARDHDWFAGRLLARYLPAHPDAAALARACTDSDEQLHRLQRATAKPWPYRFVIRRAEDAAK